MSQGQKLTLKAAGLYTQPNQLGETPEGAMSVADNVDIQRDGVIEPVVGLGTGIDAGAGSKFFRHLAPYGDRIFFHRGSGASASVGHMTAGTSSGNPDEAAGVTEVASGTGYERPSLLLFEVASAEANGLLFFTTASGTKQVEGASFTSVYDAGVPAAVEPVVSLGTATGYAIQGDSQYAYRVVWGRKDSVGNVQYGAPSGRAILQSASMPTAVGGSVRTGGNLVTVTTVSAHGLTTGEYVVLPIGATGTASFAAGTYQITSTGTTTFTYAEAGTNGASTIALTYRRTTRDATVLVPIPVGADSTYFFQVYRSAASGGSDIEPDDSLALVYEGTPPATSTVSTRTRSGGNLVTVTTSAAHGLTSGAGVCLYPDITNFTGVAVRATVTGANTFTYADTGSNVTSATAQTVGPLDAVVADAVPDSIAGQALYTNPEQQTITKANDRPPPAKVLATFRGAMFYGNFITPYTLKTQFVDVDSANGLQSGDAIAWTPSPNTITAQAAPTIIARQFQLYTTATAGSTALAVERTARAFCTAFNYYNRWAAYRNDAVLASALASARYLSTADDPPGKIALVALGVTDGVGTVSCARGTAFSPALSPGVAATRSSARSRLMWSNPNEPWAVPSLNYQDLGSASAELLAVVALRDSAFVFKEDGVWRVTGDGSTWQIAPFDPTVVLLAPRGACALANAVYALTNQGIVQITDTGVTVISRPIDDVIRNIDTAKGSSYVGISGDIILPARSLIQLVGFESDRSLRVHFVNPLDLGGKTTSRALRYNLFTRAWSSRSLDGSPYITSACVSPVYDQLYLGTKQYVWRERKRTTGSSDDAAIRDPLFLSTTSVGTQPSATSVVLTSATGVAVGDYLVSGIAAGSVTAVNGTTITLDRSVYIGAGSAVSVYRGITSTWQWSAKVGNPGALHRFREASLLTQLFRAASWLFSFRSNLATSATQVTFTGDSAGSSTPLNRRTYVPKDQHVGHQMDVKCQVVSGGTTFQINGVSLIYSVISPRLTR